MNTVWKHSHCKGGKSMWTPRLMTTQVILSSTNLEFSQWGEIGGVGQRCPKTLGLLITKSIAWCVPNLKQKSAVNIWDWELLIRRKLKGVSKSLVGTLYRRTKAQQWRGHHGFGLLLWLRAWITCYHQWKSEFQSLSGPGPDLTRIVRYHKTHFWKTWK